MADPTQIVEQRVGLAPEIAPYAQTLLGTAQKQMGTPYQSYQDWAKSQGLTGEQIAQFTPLQQEAFKSAGALDYSPESIEAAQGLGSAAAEAAKYAYTPGQFTNQFQAPQAYQAGQFSFDKVQGQQALAAQLGMTPQMQAALNQYQPNLQQYAMAAQPKVATKSFTDAGTAAQYMSPYAQNVIAVQQREAQRAADIAKTGRAAQAVGAGAFGGSRQGVMEAEAARNLATQMGDIQATGSQAAFQQAQQQFNAEQGYGLSAQQANLQAGLTVGQQNLASQLGVQQLGTQTGLQALLANQANQQAAAAANQQMAGQYGLQQGQFSQAANLQASQQAQQAALANQQAAFNAQQAAEASRQFGAGQTMTAAQSQAQYGQAAQQLGEQSRQYGSGIGLQGLQTGMQGFSNLGTIGQNLYGQNIGNIGLQQQLGTQQQQQMQNVLGTQQANYAAAQNYPYKQMGFMSDIIRGVPLSATGSSLYQAPPSMLSQVAGLGAVGKGLGAFAKGGLVKSKNAGLAALLVHSMG